MAQEKEPAEVEAQEEHAARRRHHRSRDAGEHAGQLEARVGELERALAEKEEARLACEKDAREYLEGWQRERANFENFRKRKARELDDAGIIARVELIRSILPAMDNLERVLGDQSSEAETVRRGVKLTYDQLFATLQRQGLEPIPSAGEPFDPNVHEAIEGVDDTEYAPDTVIEDVQRGYKMGERLVRPARVRVAR